MSTTIDTNMRTVGTIKGSECFTFRYEEGSESIALDAMVEMVNRRIGFDWYDAAVCSHQLGQHLAKELMAYFPKVKT